jgi:hypothetical protein
MSTAEERMQDAIDELEQENRLLRARNDRLESEAKVVSLQEPDAMGCKCSKCGEWQRWTPSGMVCKNGHGGVGGINHRLYTTPPAAQRQWVGLTDDAKLDLISDAKGIGGRVRSDAQLFVLLDMQEAKLKEKNL